MEGLGRIPEQHQAVIEFGFETGLRPSETCALKICDLNLKEHTLRVQRTWSNRQLIETTKGKNKWIIPLSDRAFEIINAIVQERFKEGVFDVDQFLFINPATGRHYNQRYLQDLWKEHSGIPVTHYEASRHSFCTQIVETGADALTARLLLRQADLKSTMQYYHGTPKRLKDIVNRRGKVVNFTPAKQKESKVSQ